jgi:hypothetical protein
MRFLLVLFSFSFSISAFTKNGEDSTLTSKWIAGFNLGGIWAHNKDVAHLAQSHTLHVFGEYQFVNHKKEWPKYYHLTYFGIGLKYLDYNSKPLGRSVCGLAFMEKNITKRLSYRIGTGFAYNSNPWTAESNFNNIMLGSNIAAVMHGQVNFLFGKRIRIGLGLTHFSNGSFSQPNSGINNFFISTAYIIKKKNEELAFQLKPTSLKEDSMARVKKKFSFSLAGSFSRVELSPDEGKKYSVFQVESRVQYRLGRKSSLLTGLDWKRNGAVEQEIKNDTTRGTQPGVIGIPIGHELHISRVSLISEFGVYVFKKHKVHPGFYQRYGLRYFWNKGLHTAIYLQSHKARAECLELVVGYHFGHQN